MIVQRNLLLTIVTCAVASIATAADVKIIANPSVKTSAVSAEDLKSVFLVTKTSLADGSHVQPVLQKDNATHETFLKSYLGKTDAALQTYYRSLVFTGKASMPKSLAADSEVVSYVARTPGAVGYIAAGTSAAGVRTLDIK